MSVKHLNPRQGITTPNERRWRCCPVRTCETPKSPPGDYNSPTIVFTEMKPALPSVKHLNPRQGITTGCVSTRRNENRFACVKHLNPRQGITTRSGMRPNRAWRILGVKHLNPRQGITTQGDHASRSRRLRCETPKSPPGDYNCEMFVVQHPVQERLV